RRRVAALVLLALSGTAAFAIGRRVGGGAPAVVRIPDGPVANVGAFRGDGRHAPPPAGARPLRAERSGVLGRRKVARLSRAGVLRRRFPAVARTRRRQRRARRRRAESGLARRVESRR